MANYPMLLSRFKLQGVCLALTLATLAGCGQQDSKKPEVTPAARSVAELPATDLRNQALAKAKSLSSTERRAVLADTRWAKQTEVYGDLMKKAVVASDKLSDKETLALGDKMYKAHAALLKAAGRDHTQVIYLLRAEAVGTKEELLELGKFSTKLRSVRGAKQMGDSAGEQRRQAYLERMKARQAEAQAKSGRPVAPASAAEVAATKPGASATAPTTPTPAAKP